MTIYFVGTAVWDSVYRDSIDPENLINQSLAGAAVTAALACKLNAPNEKVIFVGEIGDDECGMQFNKQLTEAGIDILLEPVPGSKTSQALWIINHKGEKKLIIGAAHLLQPRGWTEKALMHVSFSSDDIVVFCSKTTTENWLKYSDMAMRAFEANALIITAPNTRAFVKDNASDAELKEAMIAKQSYLEYLEHQLCMSSLTIAAESDLKSLLMTPKINWKDPVLDIINLPSFYVLTRGQEATQIFSRNEGKGPIAEIPVEAVDNIKNIVGTGDMTLGAMVGGLVMRQIYKDNLGIQSLSLVIADAQKFTHGELLRRRRSELVSAANNPKLNL